LLVSCLAEQLVGRCSSHLFIDARLWGYAINSSIDAAANETLDLRRYIAVLKTRRWWIIVTAVLVTAVALGISSRQTPLYRASTSVLVKENPSLEYFPNPENEAAVVASAPVADLVIRELDLDMRASDLLANLSTNRSSETADIISVEYVSEDPELARDIANTFAENYQEFRIREATEQLESTREAIQSRIDRVETELEDINREIQAAGNDADEVASLETRRVTVSARLGVLLQDLDDLQANALVRQSVAEILAPAVTPTAPFKPNHAVNALLGVLIGALLGVGLAFVRERFDDRFRGRPDVERALQAPVLATVPRYGPQRGDAYSLPAIDDPRGAASEAYRNLRTGLQFISSQRGISTILISSPSAHEGKTSTTANLGIAMSQAGRRTVIVSGDLRRPQVESAFGAQSETGLSSWLLGDTHDIGQALLQHPQIPGLYLLPSGPIPSNPAELLTSPRLGELFALLESMVDTVLVDSPPILPVADAVILASHVESVVLVLDASKTARSAAVHAKELIERVGASLLGCVLNAFDPSTTPYYYEPYYYSQYYGEPTEEREDAPRPVTFLGESQQLRHRR